MDNQEIRNEEGISLLDIIRVILKRKIVLGVTTGVVFIVGVLAIMLFYNKHFTSYTSEFEYTYPSLVENEFIDGSKFEYRDLVSLETLEKVKSSSKDFSSINVEKMYDNNDISISIIKEIDEKTESVDYSYSINISSKYFKNQKQAKSFISALVETPTKKNIELLGAVKHDSYLSLFDDATIYEIQVSMLESQYNLLMDKYNQLISYFDDVLLSDGKVISAKAKNLEANFNSDYLSSLYDEIKLNGYIKENSVYKNQLMVRKETLLKNKEINEQKLVVFEQKINSVTDTNSSNSIILIESYTAEIVKIVNENFEIDKEIEEIEKKLDHSNDSNAFEIKLTAYRDKLEEFTNEFCKVEAEMVNSNSKVFYSNNSVAEINGDINFFIAAVISIFAGFVCGAVLNLFLGHNELSKKKENLED